MQLVVALQFALQYKTIDIIIHIPFSIYRVFYIEIPEGMSESTPGSYVRERAIVLLEFVFINTPMLLVFCLIALWSGKWFWLVCILTTGIFKSIILYIYPVIVMPIFSQQILLSSIEEKQAQNIHKRIQALAASVKFPADA